MDLEPPRLDLRQIEDLVDDLEQRLGRMLHGLGVGLLLGRQLGIEHQPGHAEDAVHWRADLVAHRREEPRFRIVGRQRLIAHLGERQLGAPLLRDVAPDRLILADAAIRIEDRLALDGKPAPTAGRLHLLLEALDATRGSVRHPALGDLLGMHRAEHAPRLDAEHPAIGAVDERQAILAIGPPDDLGLAVEQIAVAGLALAKLPPEVVEPLEPGFDGLD